MAIETHEDAYTWLHADARIEYSGCRAAAEAMKAEIDRLEILKKFLEDENDRLIDRDNRRVSVATCKNGVIIRFLTQA